MKTICIECCECDGPIFLEFKGDNPVGMDITCPNCGQDQSVEGGWIQGKDAPEYWGETVDGDEFDDD